MLDDNLTKILDQPIFALTSIKDFVLIVAGGGGSRFGLKNAIISFKYEPNRRFGDPIFNVEFPDAIPIFIHSFEAANLFCTCADATTYVYELDNTGKFAEKLNFSVSDYNDKQFLYQTMCKFIPELSLIVTGMTDGTMKVWEMELKSGKLQGVKFSKELHNHSKQINDVIYIKEKGLIVTASADGSAKIFDKTFKNLKHLNFRESINDKINLSIRGICYDKNTMYLYTMQAPLRGSTYVTKWDINNSFYPLDTNKVCDISCGPFDYSEKLRLMAIGSSDGNLIFADGNSLEVLSNKQKHSLCVKTLQFKGSNLISGSPDYRLRVNTVSTSSFVSFIKFLFYLLVLGLAVFVGMNYKKPDN